MKKFFNLYFAAALAALTLFGCSKPEDDKKIVEIMTELPVVSIKSVDNTTLVLGSDYVAGSYGIISSDKYVKKALVDSDADLCFADGNFYILERSNQGKLIFMSAGGEIIRQLPFQNSAYFNAHGVCGDGAGKIFVGSYEDLTIAVFEKSNGDISYKNNISLSVPQSSGGTAKLQDLKYFGGKIYAALQYLDASWNPSGVSKILEINPSNGAVERTFESNFSNVVEIEIRQNNLFVLDMGAYFALDGGITKIDLTSGTKQTVLKGAEVGADPQKIEFISDSEAYLLMLIGYNDDFSANSYVANFQTGGSYSLNAVSELNGVKSVSAISYNKSQKTLYLASANKVFKF